MKAWESVRPDLLAFPIGEKVYEVPPMPYQSMLAIMNAKAGKPSALDDAEGDALWRLLMSTAYDEMVADNVPGEALTRAGYAALAFFEAGTEAAEQIWESGVDPKALKAALLAQVEQSKPTSTAVARKTPSRASGRGTSSRPAGPKKAPTKRASQS